jgi:uncharacterized protein (TIGR00369 family)
MLTADDFNARGAKKLPGHLGIVITSLVSGEVRGYFEIAEHLMAPNGFLHAGSVITLADSCAGYGCAATLPAGANGFTTIELKSNFLGTARSGRVECIAKLAHGGKTTQVWDATVTSVESGKTMALFRCTQMVLYPKKE